MNPPYGSVGGDTIHLKFVDKCLDIANKQVSIFPFALVTKLNKHIDKFKDKFSKYLISVNEIQGNVFPDTHMPNVGIYLFSNDKNDTEKIYIYPITGDYREIYSLNEISKYSNYEKEIISYLENNGQQDIIGDCGRLNSWKKQIADISNEDKNKKILELVVHSLKKVKEYYSNNRESYGLLVNRSNGGMNGTAFTSENGQILNSYNSFIDFFKNHVMGIGYCALMFKTKKAAVNCKIALQHPVLRFTLYRNQDDQNMVPRVYKYIPNIDWSDDRVKTDEGLLQVCGCPADKAKEYAEYCKKIIEEVDNK